MEVPIEFLDMLTDPAVNDARAMRVAEVMNDFRTLQHLISQFQASPDSEAYNETGYVILRQCTTQAQALLSQHFDTGSLHVPSSPGEQTKRQLQRYRRPVLEAYPF